MLSQRQIARGLEALEKLAEALTTPADADLGLSKLSSDFYTIIPHNFGRQQPPPIDSPRLLQVEKDILLVRARRWAGRRLPNRQTGQGTQGTDGREGPERRTAVDRPKDRGEGQTDGAGANWWTDKWGGHSPRPVGERGQAGGQVDRQLPVPIILGAGHRRQAGPDPGGSPQGGGRGGRATPPGPSLPAPRVPAPAARPGGA